MPQISPLSFYSVQLLMKSPCLSNVIINLPRKHILHHILLFLMKTSLQSVLLLLMKTCLHSGQLLLMKHVSILFCSCLHAIAYSTFCKLWQFQLPQIKLMKPITDLCWTCQQNSSALLKCANSPEKQKSETAQTALEHLRIVQCERSYYKTTCDNCRRDVENFFTESNTFQPPPLASHTPANFRSIKVHYSFDYAQQIHYSSDSMQPGPIYFMTLRKCSIFGVNCEALPRQVNFLTDAAGDCGKGTNTVISQLDFFFTQHEKGVVFTCR